MSAIIEELRLKNFEGYKRGTVKFTNGLNLITGRNSTGKSTLLNALLFTLYGQIPGVHKKLLVSRLPGVGEMVVYVRFKNPVSGAMIEISRNGCLDKKRGYKTTKLTLLKNGREVEVESDEDLRRKVTEYMSISLKKFTNLVYVRQGALQDILQPDKKDMDLILRLTVVRELREQMDKVRRVFEKYEGKHVQTKLDALKNLVIPQLQKNLEDLEEDVKDRQRKLQKLKEQIEKAKSPELSNLLEHVKKRDGLEEELRRESKNLQDALSEAELKSQDEIPKLIEKTQEKHEKLMTQRDTLQKETKKLNEEWGSHSGKAQHLQDEIEKHEELLKAGITRCPTCGQDLNEETLQGILEKKKKNLQNVKHDEELLKKAYNEKNKNLQKLEDTIRTCANKIEGFKNLRKTLQTLMTKREEIENKIQECNKLIETGLKFLDLPFKVEDPELKVKVAQRFLLDPEKLEDAKKEYENIKKKIEEKTSEKNKKKEDLRKDKKEMVELEKRLEAAELARQLTERLEAAIKTRRSDMLKKIEVRALSYYERMTDQHDYDSIRINPETYVVSVHPKGLVEHIPAMRDGGGHQTILALAVRLALLETLRFRSLLILDEPTYGVDSKNIPQIAEYLGETARLLAQTILVTHHDICEEEASNIIEVEKDEKGVSFVKTKF